MIEVKGNNICPKCGCKIEGGYCECYNNTKDEEVLIALQTMINYCNHTGCSVCVIREVCEKYTTLPFNDWGKEPIK